MTCVSPSDSTPERCLSHTPLSVHRLAFSLPRALEFFSMTSRRIRLSSARSAYICLRLRFSSSSSFRRCTWLTSMPLYFAFHLYKVVLDIPCSRAITSPDIPLSNCLTALTISVSLCLLFFIMTKIIIFVNFNSVPL